MRTLGYYVDGLWYQGTTKITTKLAAITNSSTIQTNRGATKMKAAKEKALELLQKFGLLGMKWKQTEYYTLDKENAKQCALIAVDEILNLPFETQQERNYWYNVKKELEAL